jgi:C-terminal peptidase prc
MRDDRRTVKLLLLLVLGIAGGLPVTAQEGPKAKPLKVDADTLLAEAGVLEKKGEYDKALELYLKAYSNGKADTEIREHIRFCFRNIAQTERHRDAAFQQFVVTLTPTEAITLYAEALDKIHKIYVDPDKATFERMFAAGLDELDRALAESAFRKKHLPTATDSQVAKFRQAVRDGWRKKLPVTAREVLHAARELISSASRQLELRNGSVVVLELLCGACNGLDEYSSYLSPGALLAEQTSPILELASYGLLVRWDPKGLLIDLVLPGSWAAGHTKLQKGDRITTVNGKPMPMANTTILFEALRSPTPYGHELEVISADSMNVVTIQLPTPVPTVYGSTVLNPKEGIGYLKLSSFRYSTLQEFTDAVMELKARGMKALVVDLRGNAGGSFTAAVEIARLLLPSGIIVSTQGQSAEFANRVFSSESGMNAYDFPLVLLVDAKTMSAAEILAASLKDNLRATLVGVPTYGKGYVQAPIALQSRDGPESPSGPMNKSGVVILSIASVHGPSGASLNGGISPHFTEADPDRQLTLATEKAIEILLRPMPMIMR